MQIYLLSVRFKIPILVYLLQIIKSDVIGGLSCVKISGALCQVEPGMALRQVAGR